MAGLSVARPAEDRLPAPRVKLVPATNRRVLGLHSSICQRVSFPLDGLGNLKNKQQHVHFLKNSLPLKQNNLVLLIHTKDEVMEHAEHE